MAATASRPGEDDVARVVDAIADQVKRDDSRALIGIMTDATGEDPKLWGSVIGFGTCHYRYESGREGHSAKVGFSPRKTNLTIYLLSGMVGYDDLLSRLGKHTTGKSCIYVKRLADLDMRVLTELITRAVQHIDQAGWAGCPGCRKCHRTGPIDDPVRRRCPTKGRLSGLQSISTWPLTSPPGKLTVWTLT